MTGYSHLSSISVQGAVESTAQGKLIGSFDTMPAASAQNAGQIVLYTGPTGTYVKGKYYTSNGSAWNLSDASPVSVSVDSMLSDTSTNPVQNKVIKDALDGKLEADGTAVRATADANGDVITTTYLTNTSAVNNYLSKTDASSTYLTKTDASNTYATKSDISSVYRYKGSVATYSALPSGASVGDTYNVEAAEGNVPAGTNWAWNGSAWDALAGTVDLSGLQAKLTAGSGISISGDTISLATSGVTAGSKGSTTAVPVITVDSYGRVTSLSSSDIYPPTTAGTDGQYWKSDGSGAGVWTTPATSPSSGSSTLITAGGVYTAIDTVNTAIAAKQNTITASTSTPSSSTGSNGDFWAVYE